MEETTEKQKFADEVDALWDRWYQSGYTSAELDHSLLQLSIQAHQEADEEATYVASFSNGS